MELLYLATPIIAIAALLFFFIFPYHLLRKKSEKTLMPPKAAGALPIIGHLHLLGGPDLPHITLGSMADKYGPIFTIKLGVHQALIVSDSKIVKECFTTNDKAFASRPKSVAVELMGYNYAMFGLSSYGPYWRQMRKLVSHELLSDIRIERFAHLRVSEVKLSIKEIYDFWIKKSNGGSNKVKMEMKKWFGNLTLNMVVRMLVGKRFSWDDEIGCRSLKAIRKFIELTGRFVVSDFIPMLRLLDIGGHEKAMKINAGEIDFILEGWLSEHKKQRELESQSSDHHDFMDVMLSSVKDFGGFDADTIIKSTCLALLSGATDTTMVILGWALTLLVNNPEVLQKARDEIDKHVGKERNVVESDICNLVYLQAIIKESMRLHPAGQLLAPHESIEDCTVNGYFIPKGTRLVVNLWKVHRDPNVWSDPHEFRPERFLTDHKHVDVTGKNFELLPFGTGRRMCPAFFLGLRIIHLTLASLVQGFEFERSSTELLDMSEGIGLSNIKEAPLELFIKPRLSPLFDD